MPNPLVNFRADPQLMAALYEQARASGYSVSEYLRAMIREKIGFQ